MIKYAILLIIIFNLTSFFAKDYLLIVLLITRIFTFIYLRYTVKRLNRNYLLWNLFGLISPILTSLIIAFIGFNFDYNQISEHVRKARLGYKLELSKLLKKEKINLTAKKQELLDKHNNQLTLELHSILNEHGIYDQTEEKESSGLMEIIGSLLPPKNIDNSDSKTFNLKQERIGNLISSMTLLVIIVILLIVYY